MWILLGFVLIIVVSVGMARMDPYYSGELWLVFAAVGVVGIFTCVLTIPIGHMATHARLHAMEEVRYLAENPRDDWERAAYQQKVSEYNEWLSSARYWADSPLHLWWPKEIHEVEMIR